MRIDRSLVVAGLATAALSVAGCSTQSNGEATGSADSGVRGAADSAVSSGRALGAVPRAASHAAAVTSLKSAAVYRIKDPAQRRAVISTGDISLTSRDVAGAAADVRRLVRQHDGRVEDQSTQAGRRGSIRSATLTVRVPSARFDGAFAALQHAGHLRYAKSGSEDVTTQVIDVGVRVRAERAGLNRVEALLARAGSIRQILTIEDQITRRQAQLDSLEQRQAYLHDQTSMSTITVTVTRAGRHHARPAHHNGLWAGLVRGWHGLGAAASVALTVLGMVLPFAIPVGVVAVPLWWVRRRRARATKPASA